MPFFFRLENQRENVWFFFPQFQENIFLGMIFLFLFFVADSLYFPTLCSGRNPFGIESLNLRLTFVAASSTSQFLSSKSYIASSFPISLSSTTPPSFSSLSAGQTNLTFRRQH